MAVSGLKALARGALWFESLALALMVLAFWYPTPARTDWLWLLWLLLPILGARFVLRGRVLTRTPLDGWFAAFLILGVINVYAAPYTRGLMMLARPLLGMVLYYAMIESARTAGDLRGPLQALTLLGLLVGLLALGSSQWNFKANTLQFVIDALPTIKGFPGAEGGFNANEIAGALTWLAPLMGGLAVLRWQQRAIRWDVTLAFVMLFGALLLGQSRSAVIGMLVTLFLMIPLLVRGIRWRAVAYVAFFAVIGLQVLMTTDFSEQQQRDLAQAQSAPATSEDSSKTYDEQTLFARVQIWQSALEIIHDYPLTGVGLSMFRDRRVRNAYPAPIMEDRIIPHAHNEVLQIGSDMGIPGLIVYLGIHLTVGYMLLKIWRAGDRQARAVSVAIAGGMLAHTIFGLADAITLWDRFAFVFWMLPGLAGAQYVLVTQAKPVESPAE